MVVFHGECFFDAEVFCFFMRQTSDHLCLPFFHRPSVKSSLGVALSQLLETQDNLHGVLVK